MSVTRWWGCLWKQRDQITPYSVGRSVYKNLVEDVKWGMSRSLSTRTHGMASSSRNQLLAKRVSSLLGSSMLKWHFAPLNWPKDRPNAIVKVFFSKHVAYKNFLILEKICKHFRVALSSESAFLQNCSKETDVQRSTRRSFISPPKRIFFFTLASMSSSESVLSFEDLRSVRMGPVSKENNMDEQWHGLIPIFSICSTIASSQAMKALPSSPVEYVFSG